MTNYSAKHWATEAENSAQQAELWATQVGDTIPYASDTVAGKIKSSSSILVNSDTGVATVPTSTTTTSGIIKLSTDSLASTGTDTSTAMTPALVASRISAVNTLVTAAQTDATSALADAATAQTAASAAQTTADSKWTAVDASTTVKGIAMLATLAEVQAGTNTTKYITPKLLKDYLDSIGAVITITGDE